MRILVAEDDPSVADLLEMVLSTHGHAVTRVSDGDAAVSTFEGGRFDLVVLDVMMPGRSGIEVLGHIRSTDRDLPVVLLTARATEDDHLRGYEAGADAYVTKPFDPDELLERLRAVAARSADQRREDRRAARERARFLRSLEHRF